MRSKTIALLGPTAVGKTDLAVKICKELDGEILSVDSRQIYKEMDVVTGKDMPKDKIKSRSLKLTARGKRWRVDGFDFYGTRIWGVDLVSGKEKFSAADFAKIGRMVIKDIFKRGKLAVLTVGTYFYLKALLGEIDTLGIEPDWELRKKLSSLETKELKKKLRKLDLERFKRMNLSDRNNPRRLIRAIEVARKSEVKKEKVEFKKDYEVVKVGLKLSRERIYEKIEKRVDERVKMGAFEEARGLVKKGLGWEMASMTGIGYRQIKEYLEGEKSKEEVLREWKAAEKRYFRQQMGWFKKDKEIVWFDLEKKSWREVLFFVKKTQD